MGAEKSLAQLPKAAFEHFKNSIKSVRFYLMIGAFACMLIGLILYISIDGTSAYLKEISNTAIALYALGMAFSLIVLFVPFKMAYILTLCLTLSAPLVFLTSQASFIVNVFTAIDGQSFSAAFILAAVFPLIAVGLTLASSILVKEPTLFAEKPEEPHEASAADKNESDATEETA